MTLKEMLKQGAGKSVPDFLWTTGILTEICPSIELDLELKELEKGRRNIIVHTPQRKLATAVIVSRSDYENPKQETIGLVGRMMKDRLVLELMTNA